MFFLFYHRIEEKFNIMKLFFLDKCMKKRYTYQ